MLDMIMRLAATNASKQFQALDSVSTNVANYNTTGYKAKRFEHYLMSDNNLGGVQRVDTSSGDIMMTQRELDVAIDGFGYLPVTQPDGQVAYTRDGSLTLNSKGYLVTQKGDMVGNGIQVPLDYKTLQVKPDGTVSVTTAKDPAFKPIGKITLTRFANPEGLKNLGDNKLAATDASGQAQTDADSQLKQGMLERSNVDIHTQIEQVLRLNASLISNLRIIKFADDLYRQSVNLKQ